MNYNWIIDILFNGGAEKKQVCLSDATIDQKLFRNAGDEADVLLYINEDELVIERVGNADVVVKRGVRERQLSSAQTIRILPKDRIRMGSCECQIDNIYRQSTKQSHSSSFAQYANKALLATGAVAVMLAAVPACASKNASMDAITPDVKVQQEVQQERANEPTPVKTEVQQDTAPETANHDTVRVMCLNNSRYEQVANQPWKRIETCKAPALCKVNYDQDRVATSTYCNNAEPCQDGTYACFGGDLRCEKHPGVGCYRDDLMYQCQNQQWVLKQTCADNEQCQLNSDHTEAECVTYPRIVGKPAFYTECNYGQSKCDLNAVMDCQFGKWHYQSVCSNGENCKVDANGDASCVPLDEQ